MNAVSATLFTDSFVAALTADVNAYLAVVARRPLASTRKLEQDIANRERQLARLTARLDKVGDERGIDAIFEKVAEMERELKAKREELAEQRRRNCRPSVKRVKEKDVTAMVTQVRDVPQGDIGRAAPMLKALVGDVVIESRAVDGHSQPGMFARFRIDAVPALAALGPVGKRSEHDVPQTVWGHYASDAAARIAPRAADQPEVVVSLHYDRRAAARELRCKRRGDA